MDVGHTNAVPSCVSGLKESTGSPPGRVENGGQYDGTGIGAPDAIFTSLTASATSPAPGAEEVCPASPAASDAEDVSRLNGSAEALDAYLKQNGVAGSPSAHDPWSPQAMNHEVNTLLSQLSKESLRPTLDRLIVWANGSKNEEDGRTLKQLVSLLLDNAIDNAGNVELYVKICSKITDKIDPDIRDHELKEADGKPVAGGHLFRKYLISRCQDQFEQGFDGEEDSATDVQRSRRRHLGLIKFISELFKLKILSSSIVRGCVDRLLETVESSQGFGIESLEMLLTSVGRQLDVPKRRSHMNDYFWRIEGLSQDPVVSASNQLKLQALIDLRRAGWKTEPEASQQLLGDDSVGGHPLGGLNISSTRKAVEVIEPASTLQPPPLVVPAEATMLPTPALPANPGDSEGVDVPPRKSSMTGADARTRAGNNTTEFFSVRDVVASEKYFTELPPEHRHLLVDALLSTAVLSNTRDAELVASLFHHASSNNLCSPASFEEGFTPTTKDLADIVPEMPNALELYACMFKGARLDEDVERWPRILSESMESEDLLPFLFGAPVQSAPRTAPRAMPPAAPSVVATVAGTVPAPPPPGPGPVANGEAPKPTPVLAADPGGTGREKSEGDPHARSPEFPAAPNPHVAPAHAPYPPQRRLNRPEVVNHPAPTSDNPASPGTNVVRVEERSEDSATPPLPDRDSLPPVQHMSQKDANKRIDQSVETLFGGPHDIDKALSAFTDLSPRHHSRLVDRLISFAIESTRADAQLVAYFFYCAVGKNLCSPAALEGGFSMNAAALKDIVTDSPDAVVLFAAMAKGAGMHKNEGWRKRYLDRFEKPGLGADLGSLFSV